MLLVIALALSIGFGCSDDDATGGGGQGGEGSGGRPGTGGGTTATVETTTSSSSSSSSTGGGMGGSGGEGGGTTSDAGHEGSELVSAGEVCESPEYRLVYTLGQPTTNQQTMNSTGYRLQGGFVGATGSAE